MNKRNYQRELEKCLAELDGQAKKPSLLLHSCCAPCSSYVLEYLRQYFCITVFYYNPNIYPAEEYDEREREQKRLIREMNAAPEAGRICFAAGEYRPEQFFFAVRGLEKESEGGSRCTECFRLRLFETAKRAREEGFDYFTTTLTLSPLKDAERLNRLGEEAASEFHVPFLHSDFKKKNGYQRSLELSREYGLYRQNYCGCVFSRREDPPILP